MMAITLAQAQEKLDKAMAAYDKAIEKPQSYSHGSDSESFSASSHNLDSLEQAVNFWERKVAKLSRGGRLNVRTIIPSC